MRRPRIDQRGFGFIEIVIVLAVVAVAGLLTRERWGWRSATRTRTGDPHDAHATCYYGHEHVTMVLWRSP